MLLSRTLISSDFSSAVQEFTDVFEAPSFTISSLFPFSFFQFLFLLLFLFVFFSLFQTLELIDLSSNKINDEDFKNITFAIKNSKLKSLFLGLTKVQGDSLSAFSERLLSSRTCPLTHLCLKRNVLCGKRSGEDFNPESVVMVANALLESNRNLKYLNLSHCDIGARSGRKLMESVKYNDSLLVLDMGSCNISSIGGAAVAQALPFMKNLRSLNIRDNAIGPVGSNVSTQYSYVLFAVTIFCVHTVA